MNGLAEVLHFGPEIDAIDITVGIPQRTMVWMIVLLIRRTFHGPIPSHGRISRTNDRITIRPRHILEKVFREKLPVDFDVQAIVEPGDLNALRGRSTIGGQHLCGSGESHNWDTEANEIHAHAVTIVVSDAGKIRI